MSIRAIVGIAAVIIYLSVGCVYARAGHAKGFMAIKVAVCWFPAALYAITGGKVDLL